MANQEYFQGDSRDSYQFVGRRGPDSRSTSPYPPRQGGDPYASNYGGGGPQNYPPQHQQSGYGGQGQGGYSGQAPPARYEPGPPQSNYGAPPPAYGHQSDPYGQPPRSQGQYGQQQYGQSQYGQGQQQYGGGSNQSQYGGSQQQQYGGPQYGQQQPSHGYPQQQPGGPGAGPGGADEGDRGIMGALGGAAAGGYGGHKMGHGIIGTIGGAVAGSVLEDHLRKDKKEDKQREKDEKERRKQEEKQRKEWEKQNKHGGGGGMAPPPQGHPGNFAGNFSQSSKEISLDRDFDLIAKCGDGGGGERLTSLSLNDCLTNEFGNFKWQRGGNFGGSARNVRLADYGRVLEAELADGGGGWRRSFVYLDERITNENGELRFID